jgi:hypothetical protein
MKDLGVFIVAKLHFHDHVNYISGSSSQYYLQLLVTRMHAHIIYYISQI